MITQTKICLSKVKVLGSNGNISSILIFLVNLSNEIGELLKLYVPKALKSLHYISPVFIKREEDIRGMKKATKNHSN